MSQAHQPTGYDSLPYPGVPIPRTHPDHLATLATLFGMRPPHPARCRVLELGCGSGENLTAMAVALPESQFVGIDLAASQIAQGRARIEALGLPNITLQQMDILDVPEELGIFDYIIAPGVYSWVPWIVKEQILALFRRHLAPEGVAYISYNTYPGWHLRGMLREMMLYHTRDVTDVAAQVGRARELLDLLARAVPAEEEEPNEREAYGLLLHAEQQSLQGVPDAYIAHDLLEPVNEPVYFTQFVERAARHGLQYLADAHFAMMLPSNIPDAQFEKLNAMTGNLIELEQYLDFIRNRTFRQTLLCHRELSLTRELGARSMAPFLIASPAQSLAPAPDAHADEPESFRGPTGTQITLSRPMARAALRYLGELWPRAVSFDALLGEARARSASGDSEEEDARRLGDLLLNAYAVDMVRIHLHPPSYAIAPGERPIASPLARLQASQGEALASLRHESVTLDDALAAALLPHLDGTRDRAALREIAERTVAPGEDAGAALERALGLLGREALLLA